MSDPVDVVLGSSFLREHLTVMFFETATCAFSKVIGETVCPHQLLPQTQRN